MKNVHTLFIISAVLVLMAGPDITAAIEVKEDSLTIATYLVNPPNPLPRFYEGRTHQGVQRRMYPYPMNDNLTRNKQPRSYHVVNMENEYIKLAIMPLLGGRIFYAEDKSNDYIWFYRQHVIKPSLIGMLGYWISGANAWGFPHHHGPNTVKPMDYKICENKDGSRTIWIANIDRRHRMRILIGYTIFPHSSLVEMTIRPQNRTPVVNSFLFWANPSVHVDTTYQVIFPPSVQYVTQHAKREMTTWPVADRRYNRYDYEGVNISLWKNIGVPSSFFSWDPKEDYFGGYDHGKQAGTVWVGNHHTCPGMKFWAWGNNPGGDRANAGLTDDDGHYIELMAGAFTDNQPDYSWLQPLENKDVKMIWFPVRELGGLKFANRDGALNLEIEDHTALLRINTTSPRKNAKVVLTAADRDVVQKTVDIGPDAPFIVDVPLPDDVGENDLQATLTAANGDTLLVYRPACHQPPDVPMPEALKPPAPPADIKTVEELYLTGLRLDQFYNASVDPMPYYEEALKRDPSDYRVNVQLGIKAIKGHRWHEAGQRLRTAVDRITTNYTRAGDGEAHYYLGYVLKTLGKLDEAYDQLYRAAWSAAWHTPAYYQLAEIDCRRGDYDTALDHLDRAVSTNIHCRQVKNLKIRVLQKLGKPEKARQLAEQCLAEDPLNHFAANELYYLTENNTLLTDLQTTMRDEVESYLEPATDYMNAGFFDRAVDVLLRLEQTGSTYPMLYYYTGYCYDRLGHPDRGRSYIQKAADMPHTYCFPYRHESLFVLQHAIKTAPDDARAPYYLGNMLYEHQPQKAVQYWQKSRDLDGSFYIVHRNLGLAAEEVEGDVEKALACYEQAVACFSDDPRLLFEIDELYEKNKAAPEKKYKLLKDNAKTVHRRTETLLRLATRAVETGHYQEAMDILNNNEFPQFEGGREMQDTWLNVYALQGMRFFQAGEYEKALKHIQTAINFPVERWGRARWAQLYCLAGLCREALGESGREDFVNSMETVVPERGRDRVYLYDHALALEKTGEKDKARKLYQKILNMSQSAEESAFFVQFEAGQSRDQQMATNAYLAGLAYRGLGKPQKARQAFARALELNPGHEWARYYHKLNE